ncbi:DUF1800 family protein [Massilia sp. TS11]|uniref:DUF1800 domain-containing protein n=1 Tax=Massilia sp. TS11 TaxID=2908003 RepID=UPI001EDA90ED|nr:DUF1800 domain-containing protein [Massilia sp. TS11]MCG2585789.1 DUF1800 domain-containing protein [Massilia sp. TS11]
MSDDTLSPIPALPAALAGAALLTACGGGGSGGGSPVQPVPSPAPSPTPAPLASNEAARFLAQASMGATRADIGQVQNQGYAAWLEAQFNMAPTPSRWDWLISKGYNNATYKNSETGFDNVVWFKLLNAGDTLRQRMTLALSEILVVSVSSLNSGGWRQFAGAAWLDLLESYAFGNYRQLLSAVSKSPAMGMYLTFRGNLKANATTGALPDENYARELLQLFTIGLVQLNLDGTPVLKNGAIVETYTQDDITQLARVFTGWDFDLAGGDTSPPDFLRRPMAMVASRHETGASSFLGQTVGAGLDGAAALERALDIIYAHPNVAPFVSKQLIQRLVTSNPSPAYVGRVAAVFENDGSGARGNLRAVLKALLLDSEARSLATAASGGKLREPILRLSGWARAYNAGSPSGNWAIGNTSDPASRLGQSPLRSPTVFNFFRPGYVPPNSGIANAGLVAPEFQITNESAVIGYINYMQRVVSRGWDDVTADYSSLLPLAADSKALLDEINTVLAAGQLGSDTLGTIRTALDSMASNTDTAKLNRIYAALTLVMAAPDYLVLK